MKTSYSNHECRAIVIAGKQKQFKDDAIHMLVRRGIEVTSCDSVYGAAGEFVNLQDNEHLLVVGPLTELNKEDGSFFQICSRKHEVTCICFIGRVCEPHKAISTAVHRGALVISGMDDFQKAVDEWLKERTIRNKMTPSSRLQTGKVTREELTVSKLELKALLEGD